MINIQSDLQKELENHPNKEEILKLLREEENCTSNALYENFTGINLPNLDLTIEINKNYITIKAFKEENYIGIIKGIIKNNLINIEGLYTANLNFGEGKDNGKIDIKFINEINFFNKEIKIKNIGTLLLIKLIEQAKNLGIEKIILTSTNTSDNFYKKVLIKLKKEKIIKEFITDLGDNYYEVEI